MVSCQTYDRTRAQGQVSPLLRAEGPHDRPLVAAGPGRTTRPCSSPTRGWSSSRTSSSGRRSATTLRATLAEVRARRRQAQRPRERRASPRATTRSSRCWATSPSATTSRRTPSPSPGSSSRGTSASPKDRLTRHRSSRASGVPTTRRPTSSGGLHVTADRILRAGRRRTTSGPWATPAPAGPARRSTSTRATTSCARRRRPGARCLGVEPASATGGSRSGTSCSCSSTATRAGDARSRCPRPAIDTGMGLERIAAVVQGKLSNFDTDLFQPLIAEVGRRCGQSLRRRAQADDVSMRVIADHARATAFLDLRWRDAVERVAAATSSDEIMRRAMRHGRLLGLVEPFLWQVTGARHRADGRRLSELCGAAEPRRRADAPRGRFFLLFNLYLLYLMVDIVMSLLRVSLFFHLLFVLYLFITLHVHSFLL